MNTLRIPTAILAVLVVLGAGHLPLHSNPSKNRWWIAGSAGYHTTEDAIANNAGSASASINSETDPRPADFITRETTVQDTLLLGLSAGYGFTDRITLQIDAGWFDGEVGPIDAYRVEAFPTTNAFNPTTTFMRTREAVIPVTAGNLTQIPIFLSGVVRFLVDRPFNPYIGAGAGVVFAEVDVHDDVFALNDRLGALRIQAVFDETGLEITPAQFKSLKGAGRVPLTHPVTVEVDDAFGAHLMAGLEYFAGDRVSLVADVRFTLLNQEVVIDLGGQDQVAFRIWSEGLFRDDGSLRYFRRSGGFPNPYRNNDPNQGFVVCNLSSTGDFDRDGRNDDLCYDESGGAPSPIGTFLVQGGTIDLSGFTASIGMRVHF